MLRVGFEPLCKNWESSISVYSNMLGPRGKSVLIKDLYIRMDNFLNLLFLQKNTPKECITVTRCLEPLVLIETGL